MRNKQYYCDKHKRNITGKYFCLECKFYKPQRIINVDKNLSFDRLIFLKMVTCKYLVKRLKAEKNHITKTLEKFVSKNFNTKEVNEKRLLIYWDEIVGQFIASKTRIVKIKNSVIYVKAVNKAFANDLIYLRESILEKVHEQLENCRFKTINFV